MDTRQTVERYFKNLYGGDWESLLAENIVFTNNGRENPRGKDVYVEATRRFMQVAKSVEVRQLIVDGDAACAVTHYSLVSPKGNHSVCDVAEIFVVKQGKIQSSSIFFDLAAFRDFMEKG